MKERNTTEKNKYHLLKIHKIRQIRSFHQSFKGSNRLHIIICDIQTIPGRNDSFTEKILTQISAMEVRIQFPLVTSSNGVQPTYLCDQYSIYQRALCRCEVSLAEAVYVPKYQDQEL